jgi:hypothetical protein
MAQPLMFMMMMIMMIIQGDQNVCAPDDYDTKTRKNILNSFNHPS